MKKKTTRYVNIAAMFKYLGEYAFLFFMPAYFQATFPTMKVEFASANALSLSILGFISAVMGGVISDKYGGKNPMTMAWVCIIGQVISIPFTVGMFMLSNNFWAAIACLAVKYLFAESWLSPAITMMQNTTKPSKQGNMISANIFFKTNAGMLATFICGLLSFHLNTKANPEMLGKILIGILAVSFAGSIPFFYLAGKSYTRYQEKKALKQAQKMGLN